MRFMKREVGCQRDAATRCSIGSSSSPWDHTGRATVEVVEEIDWLESWDAGDAGEADRTEVLLVDKDPGGAGDTDGMSELSEVVEAGDGTDWMEMLSQIKDPGGLSEIEEDGSDRSDGHSVGGRGGRWRD